MALIPIAALAVSGVVVGTTWLATERENPCSAQALDELHRSMSRLSAGIPELGFSEEVVGCDSGDGYRVEWHHPSVTSLRSAGAGLGCTSTDRAMWDDGDTLLACTFDGRRAELSVDGETWPVSGADGFLSLVYGN
ncbi:MAG TPA: hypothetical protein PLE12_05595 [Propionicimonas sp.]|nr:hypothetical protein [Propionicimonas sp.]